jgi:CRISPR-associated protein Cmr2
MSHLLAISVGPVQEFIAAARRTRDLWFGSNLLSEVSRDVAKAVEKRGKLIFPASSVADNVANVILVELNAGADPRDIVAEAKKDAKNCWLKFAEEARGVASGVIRTDIWNDQVQDVIEFYAAWVARSSDYRADRARVMRLLAGRKSCRDFLPAMGRAGVRKSSLDGQRESVLKPPSEWPARFRVRLRVREGEQLDVVGLVKRVAGGNQPYPSVARVAADPWVRGNQERLGDVISACRQLGNQVIRPLVTDAHPQFVAFPFEGTAVFMSRHHELEQETEVAPKQLRPLRNALARLPEPEPYLAILVADGDKIGEAISNLNSVEKHLAFSQSLAGFAGEARKIVNDHNGALIYAGGDDVLAFVPVDKCLDCGRKLHDKFAELLKKYGSITLSVGVAIGHFMENLEDLLEYGRTAEKKAKQPDHDGLAVHLHKRGGAPIRVRARWSENPDDRLNHFAKLMNRKIIPSKLPYELRAMAKLYEEWPNADAVIRQDLYRLIAKKSSSGEKTVREELEKYITEMNSNKLATLAEELLIARQVAAAFKQVGGEA